MPFDCPFERDLARYEQEQAQLAQKDLYIEERALQMEEELSAENLRYNFQDWQPNRFPKSATLEESQQETLALLFEDEEPDEDEEYIAVINKDTPISDVLPYFTVNTKAYIFDWLMYLAEKEYEREIQEARYGYYQ